MKNRVIDILTKHNFERYKPSLKKAPNEREVNLLEFQDIYSNGKEIYVILERLEDSFNVSEIRNFEDKINAFLYTISNNDGLKYNVNLIMICPISNANVLNFERDKYICRKIFLNPNEDNFEDEINLLPFIPISNIIEEFQTDLSNEMEFLNNITNNNKKVIAELLTLDSPVLKNIEQELLSDISGEGVNPDDR